MNRIDAIDAIKVVHRPGAAPHHGLLIAGSRTMACALGGSGITHGKSEGDGATPAGAFRALCLRFRPDRLRRPRSLLPARALSACDGWGDVPFEANYNRPKKIRAGASGERLWRDDHLYDILILLDYNFSRRSQQRGSAIFFHMARPGLTPTRGCIAVAPADMKRLLPVIGPQTVFHIG